MYGKELILDLHDCDASKFTRHYIQKFFGLLCEKINMDACKVSWWDYENCHPKEKDKAPAHLKGTSAIQFISTSNITIHTLDDLKCVYLNIFSCKKFSEDIACKFSQEYFKGIIVNSYMIDRL